jgi:hypothetical protein
VLDIVFADDGGDRDDDLFLRVFLEQHGSEHGGLIAAIRVGQFHADADGAGVTIDDVSNKRELAA